MALINSWMLLPLFEKRLSLSPLQLGVPNGHKHVNMKKDDLHIHCYSRVLKVQFQPFLPIKANSSVISASHLK